MIDKEIRIREGTIDIENRLNYLNGINFRGDYISRISRVFPKIAKINPRENFKNLLIREILGFLPKSPRKMKEIQ